MTRRDISDAIGYHYDTINERIRQEGLTEMFPNKGAASWLARRGQAA
jgi:hypothetical protein